MWIICLYSSCYQVQVKQFDTRELLSLHHLFSTHRKSTNQGSRKHTWSSICPGVISVLKTGISSTDIRGNKSTDIRGKQSTDICGVDAMCSWCRRSLLEWLESVQDRFRNLKNIQCIKKVATNFVCLLGFPSSVQDFFGLWHVVSLNARVSGYLDLKLIILSLFAFLSCPGMIRTLFLYLRTSETSCVSPVCESPDRNRFRLGTLGGLNVSPDVDSPCAGS